MTHGEPCGSARAATSGDERQAGQGGEHQRIRFRLRHRGVSASEVEVIGFDSDL